MQKNIIYLDNGATTMIDPLVLDAMKPYMNEIYGNPASVHSLGREASIAVEDARGVIAKSINAKRSEIFFTSGGTESNNWAIKSIAFANRNRGKHIITTKVEHRCVINSCKWLEELGMGFKITYLNVDAQGFIDPEELQNAIRSDTVLVSIIHGNNEIGTIQNLGLLAKICRDNNVYFHTDACQSFTKTELDVKKQNIDLVTLNAHKIHGPKGIGALYIRKDINIRSWQHGGEQERGMRSGTSNVHGIIGFAKAVEIGMNKKHIAHMTKLRNMLINSILEIPDVKLNGAPIGDNRLCNNTNFCFVGVDNEALGGILDQKGICVSAGSACSSKSSELSHVLKAIGLTDEEAKSSLRITLSRFTTKEELDTTIEVITETVKKLRKGSPFTRLAGFGWEQLKKAQKESD